MNKREFLKMGVGGFVWSLSNLQTTGGLLGSPGKKKLKNWTWITTDLKTSTDAWKRKVESMHEAGIDASVAGGASGISLFSANAMTDAHWKSFRQKAKV